MSPSSKLFILSFLLVAVASAANAADNARILSEYQKLNCSKWPDPDACNSAKTFPELTDTADKAGSACRDLPPSDGYGVTQDVVGCLKQSKDLKKQVTDFFSSWKGSGGASLQAAPPTPNTIK